MGSPMKRAMSLVVSFALVAAFALPTTAFAAQSEVQVENHTASGQTVVHGISIDGVDAPVAGAQLDDEAAVTTAEGESWSIPVLWVGDDLQLATEAAEGRTYLPVLAFFVPDGYAVEGGVFTVELSDALAKLFGSDEMVSVYIPTAGITYILPASLRSYFEPAQSASAAGQGASAATEAAVSETLSVAGSSLVDIYCAQTARDNFTDEDLEWLIDLILNKLQPQAVNLLLEKFPAFAEAADNGGIGESIGMYIYFRKGDNDGKPEHDTTSSALAFVSGTLQKCDDGYEYCYMIAIDVDDLAKKASKKSGAGYYRNPSTSKYVLVRDGEKMRTLENTLVHEMFHAFMDDYNRTGMDGRINVEEGIATLDGEFKSDKQTKLYWATKYPTWFIEGSATAVEDAYRFHYDNLSLVYPEMKADATPQERASALLSGYLDNTRKNPEGITYYVDLSYSDSSEYNEGANNAVVSRYSNGYLATLYLSELAARSDGSIGSARIKAGGKVTYSADKLRLGLNSILERLHNGETLDAVIRSISTVRDANGGKAPMYTSANDFTQKFIKGEFQESKDDPSTGTYSGDEGSLAFVVEFLDYLRSIRPSGDDSSTANGSILFDFEEDFDSPLDPTQESQSDYYRIVEDNGRVPSTVPDSEALKSGGRSRGGASGSTSLAMTAAAEEDADAAADAAAADAAAAGAAAADAESEDAALAEDADAVAAGDDATVVAAAMSDEAAAADELADDAIAAGAVADDADEEDADEADVTADDAAADGVASTDGVASDAATASDDAAKPDELDLAA